MDAAVTRDELITSHVDFARAMARKVASTRNMWGMVDDLTSEAMRGIVVAADRFDPERGVTFKTYAWHWIRHYIEQHIYSHRHIVAPPDRHDVQRVAGRIGRKSTALATELNRAPTDPELAEYMGESESLLEIARFTLRRYDISVDPTDAFTHEEGAGRGDSVVMPSQGPTPFDAAVSADERSMLEDAISEHLSEVEAEVIRSRYLDVPSMTLAEVGKRRGVTREWIRQLEARALKKLHKALRGQVQA
jgi:RNA polymerase sigma factor (sigma-70 family)